MLRLMSHIIHCFVMEMGIQGTFVIFHEQENVSLYLW